MNRGRRIYAFYGWVEDRDGRKLVEETMADHVDAALEAVDEMWWSIEGWKRLAPNFETMLRVAVMLHDVGKAVHNTYLFKPGIDLKFRGHEIISAWIAHKLFSNHNNIRKLFEGRWQHIVFAVASHHHPMGLRSRCRDMPKELLGKKIGDSILLFIDEMSLTRYVRSDWMLQEVLSQLENVGLGVKDVEIARVYQSGCGGSVAEMLSSLWRSGERKTALTLTQALVLADYRAALRNRSSKRREFEHAVETFFKLNRTLAQMGVRL